MLGIWENDENFSKNRQKSIKKILHYLQICAIVMLWLRMVRWMLGTNYLRTFD